MNGRLCLVAGLFAASVALAACGTGDSESAGSSEQERPAQVLRTDGSDLGRVVLTARAAERVGLKTESVREVSTSGASARSSAVPVAALVYDKNGGTWVYANPQPLTFVRQRVTVALSGDGGDEMFGGYRRHFLGPLLWKVIDRPPQSWRSYLAGILHSISSDRWNRLGMRLPRGQRQVFSAERMQRMASSLAAQSVEGVQQADGER